MQTTTSSSRSCAATWPRTTLRIKRKQSLSSQKCQTPKKGALHKPKCSVRRIRSKHTVQTPRKHAQNEILQQRGFPNTGSTNEYRAFHLAPTSRFVPLKSANRTRHNASLLRSRHLSLAVFVYLLRHSTTSRVKRGRKTHTLPNSRAAALPSKFNTST